MTERYLLDTNVVSAMRHPSKNPEVVAYLKTLDSSVAFISVMTLGEMQKGLSSKRRKHPGGVGKLSSWVEELEISYRDRAIPLDADIAKLWGDLSGGRTRPIVDTLIAATAIVHGLTLVTRNVADFKDLPLSLLNPWERARG